MLAWCPCTGPKSLGPQEACYCLPYQRQSPGLPNDGSLNVPIGISIFVPELGGSCCYRVASVLNQPLEKVINLSGMHLLAEHSQHSDPCHVFWSIGVVSLLIECRFSKQSCSISEPAATQIRFE